jgi:hypothetical protein
MHQAAEIRGEGTRGRDEGQRGRYGGERGRDHRWGPWAIALGLCDDQDPGVVRRVVIRYSCYGHCTVVVILHVRR